MKDLPEAGGPRTIPGLNPLTKLLLKSMNKSLKATDKVVNENLKIMPHTEV